MFGIWLAIYIIRSKTVVLEAYAVYREWLAECTDSAHFTHYKVRQNALESP